MGARVLGFLWSPSGGVCVTVSHGRDVVMLALRYG